MRFRANQDAIVCDPGGNEMLVAKGDLVFVKKENDTFKVFGFYTRTLLTIRYPFNLKDLFIPEDEFRKAQRAMRTNNWRRPTNTPQKNFVLMFLLLPLCVLCQSDPVIWSCKAARVDRNHFDFIIEGYMKRGWELYAPNNSKCILSPTVTFDKKTGLKPLGGVEVIEGVVSDSGRMYCTVPRYKSYVKYIQSFEMPITMSQVVSGEVHYQPINNNYAPSPLTYVFSRRVGDTTDAISLDSAIDMIAHQRTCSCWTTSSNAPKGVHRKVWAWIKHPHL